MKILCEDCTLDLNDEDACTLISKSLLVKNLNNRTLEIPVSSHSIYHLIRDTTPDSYDSLVLLANDYDFLDAEKDLMEVKQHMVKILQTLPAKKQHALLS